MLRGFNVSVIYIINNIAILLWEFNNGFSGYLLHVRRFIF